MPRGPGFWIVTYALGLVAVFLGFLLLTARPDLHDAATAAGATSGEASADAIRTAYTALATAVDALRQRYGL